jgi:hypothetical protein
VADRTEQDRHDQPFDGRRFPWTAERIKAMREVHPNGQIATRIDTQDPLTVIAEVYDEAGRFLARGMARHTSNSFELEDLETSAISRALKHAGFLVDDGELSARERLDFPATPEPWPAKKVKNGMVVEIADRVTAGDRDRAVELAALAWDTFGLANVTELDPADARERIAAAVELARQELATEPEAQP